jgi:hypothetical protein
MAQNLRTLLAALTLVLHVPLALAESWECGGAKIHCGGSVETCNRLKSACTEELLSHSDIDRELAQAVKDAQDGKFSSSSADPFERLTRSMSFKGCTDQDAQSSKCRVFYNAKELVSSVVDSIKFSADALNQASRILGGKP